MYSKNKINHQAMATRCPPLISCSFFNFFSSHTHTQERKKRISEGGERVEFHAQQVRWQHERGKKKKTCVHIVTHLNERKKRGVCVCLLHYRILTTLSTRPINFRPFGWGWLGCCLRLVSAGATMQAKKRRRKRSKTMAGKISPDSHAKTFNVGRNGAH